MTMNPLSDIDFEAEMTALQRAKEAQMEAHKAFLEAARDAATVETRSMLLDHADQLVDILSDLGGQKHLVREAYRKPMPVIDIYGDDDNAEVTVNAKS